MSQWLSFIINNQTYGLNINKIQEVIPFSGVNKVPELNPLLKGIISLRDKYISVFDLQLILTEKSFVKSNNSKIIIIEIDGDLIGVTADDVGTVLSVKECDISASPSLANSKIIKGLYCSNNELMTLLNSQFII